MRTSVLVAVSFIGATFWGISGPAAFPVGDAGLGGAAAASFGIEKVARMPHSHCWHDAHNHKHCSAAHATTCKGSQCRRTPAPGPAPAGAPEPGKS
jgi:hypothetical protein